MKQNLILAQNDVIGNVHRCCHGIVHLHILSKGISLRFTEETFLSFASMVKEASSQLMDEHLADLTKHSGKEKEGQI